ncbi:protein of unknown function [Kyrpidia spormannii]|uniref:Uncharacterized protein n=1 Tax=Kyrpidia spormannii TaxID=2055160 RepID=A0A6F9EHF3_9BACL|nr:protein of unknown function [Kyrpidia spormannii]
MEYVLDEYLEKTGYVPNLEPISLTPNPKPLCVRCRDPADYLLTPGGVIDPDPHPRRW